MLPTKETEVKYRKCFMKTRLLQKRCLTLPQSETNPPTVSAHMK